MGRAALCGLLAVCLSTCSVADDGARLTLRDVLEARRIITDYAKPILRSPDGTKYVLVTCRGDVAANGTWIEFFVGSTISLETARPRLIAKQFTRSTAFAFNLVQQLSWMADSRSIVFLMDTGGRSPGIYLLDTVTGRLRRLSAGSPVVEFALSENGRVLLSTTRRNAEPTQLRSKGGYVTQQSVDEVLTGDDRRGASYETSITYLAEHRTVRLKEPAYRWGILTPEPSRVSPDGRYAVLVRPATLIPSSWDLYTSHLMKDVYLPMARSGNDHLIRDFVLADLTRASTEPLWNAPQNPFAEVRWSPDGRQFVIGPTFLPPEGATGAGLEGRAVAVVDVVTRKYELLPITGDTTAQGLAPIQWSHDGTIELRPAPFRPGDRELFFKRGVAGWETTQPPANREPEPIQIQVRQDLNNPPVVMAVNEENGTSTQVFEVDPNLKERRLGRAELVHWKSRHGNDWTGVLFLPVHVQEGERYPLVIQTHGYVKEFTLDGGIPTAYAARLLTSYDIAVLQVGGPDDAELEAHMAQTPQEPEMLGADGYLGAIDALSERGLVDPKRVGIIGFSRTGWHVGYTISHHPNCFAAAITADNMDGNYLQYILWGTNTEMEKDLGAAPFGPGLKTWMANAPGFNLDRVTTPLRIEIDSGGIASVLGGWEMYAGLRRLKKAVDLFVVPDIEHGEHELQRPDQRSASLSGTVDWFRFWLLEKEDSDPSKAQQYKRWHQFREQMGRASSEGTAVCH